MIFSRGFFDRKRQVKFQILAILLCMGLLCACSNKKNALFTELSISETGIDFVNTLPEQSPGGINIIQYLYYYNGGGVAAGDLNNDGMADLFFTSNLGPNKLYLNKGNFKFEDVTEKAGVAGSGSWKTGVSLADVNGDGWLDIYVCQVGNYKTIKGKNQLFINNRDGTFTENAARFGLDLSAFCTQAVFFDFDRDNDLDCFVLCHSVHSPESYKDTSISRQFDPLASDRFYKNEGGKFVDITPKSGLRDGKSGYGLGVAVGDVNDDGYPDIYVANDFHENDFLYYNVQGQYFREGIVQSAGHTSNFSMGCDMADFNNDCRPDIVTLDMKPEDEPTLKASQPADPYPVYLYKHSFGYHWQFPRNCLQLNVAPPGPPRGGSASLSNFQREGSKIGFIFQPISARSSGALFNPSQKGWGKTLSPSPGGAFSEIAQLAGIAATDWSWSALFADLDLDGWKDLYITNGIPHRPNDNDYLKFISSNEVQRGASDLELIRRMPSGAVANYCFRNKKDLTFENVSEKWGLARKGFSNGAVYADLDNDGDLDLATNNLNEPASVYRNNTTGRNFLKIKLEGTDANRFAIGAVVRIGRAGGDFEQMLELQPVRGFQSCSEPVLIFGLDAITSLFVIHIDWPDGSEQQITGNIAVNQTLTIRQESRSKLPCEGFPEENKPLIPVELPNAYFSAEIQDLEREKLRSWSLESRAPKFYVADLNDDGLDDFFTTNTAWMQLPNGQFTLRSPPSFPLQFISKNTSCVRPADFDNDGDRDFFIGSLGTNGVYGLFPKSFLLQNDGKGGFVDISHTLPGGGAIGMVADAQWLDIEGDNHPDLVVCGEWMPLTIFRNTSTGFEKTEIPNSAGLWNCLAAADFDGDGDTDLVAGNLGLNSNLRASATEPLGLWVKDFDGNGSPDPVMSYYRQGKNYVLADKDLLVNQLPFLKKRFVEYRKYAESTFDEVFTPELRIGALHRKAEILASCYFENEGKGKWKMRPLPHEAQFSPVFAALPSDFNGDGHPDILTGGNFYEVQPAIGRFDASYGVLMTGDGKGNFFAAKYSKSGIWLPGAVRDLKIVNGTKGRRRLLVGVNNGAARVFDLPAEKPQ